MFSSAEARKIQVQAQSQVQTQWEESPSENQSRGVFPKGRLNSCDFGWRLWALGGEASAASLRGSDFWAIHLLLFHQHHPSSGLSSAW